jgi:hypothetical protein
MIFREPQILDTFQGANSDPPRIVNSSSIVLIHLTVTNERSVDSPKSLAKVARHTDAALPLTEPAMLSSTLFTDNLSGTTPSTSLSSSPPI